MINSASCATIIRLKYLTLYSDPGEFMYSTGKIGFWSLTEVGIGLIAGSLPPLRPLLSLRIGVSADSNSLMGSASGGKQYAIASNRQPTSRSRVIAMDTFQSLGDNDDRESDGDRQKNIIKETKFSVTSMSACGAGEHGQQSNEWSMKEGSHV
jgi:hypothetical protein